MITLRRAGERGHADHGWLDTRHTFSFGDYHDLAHMGYRQLRVINEDRVQPGAGFPAHGHRDMEIISYVLAGALAHKDSLGTGSVIQAGDVQRMTAGTGVVHSEYNQSATEPVHFFQVWIVPAARGLAPGYEQKTFPPEAKHGRLRLVASDDGRAESLTIHQDTDVYAAVLDAGQAVSHALRPGRGAWVQVARGAVRLNGQRLGAGDGAAVESEPAVTLTAQAPAELLLFDLA
jgi:redox-sensitive bicupin YhaK (pirin superfamily)